MKKTNKKYIDFGTTGNKVNARHLPANYTPANYTPDQVSDEGDDKVSAHLKGLDTKVVGLGGTLTFYDESILITTEIGVAGTGYNAAHTEFTLPNAKTYNGTIDALEVFAGDNLDGGLSLVEGVDFDYENSTTATKVTTTKGLPKNIRIRFRLVSLS